MSKLNLVDVSDIPKIITYEDLYSNPIHKPVSFEYIDLGVFWENLDNFGCKDYLFYSKTLIRGNALILLRKIRIKCVGGEYMAKQKNKMVFVDEVPTKHGGRQGYDFGAMLNQIPEGKAWKIGEKDHPSIATVRDYIKKHQEGKYDAVQRTVGSEKYLYVSKIP